MTTACIAVSTAGPEPERSRDRTKSDCTFLFWCGDPASRRARTSPRPAWPSRTSPRRCSTLGRARAGLPHQAGISLAEIRASPDRYSERVLLHEIGEGFLGQTGDGVTTGPDSSLGFRKLYRYPSVKASPNGPYVYEAYDLDTDPDELRNWADDVRPVEGAQRTRAQPGRSARSTGPSDELIRLGSLRALADGRIAVVIRRSDSAIGPPRDKSET